MRRNFRSSLTCISSRAAFARHTLCATVVLSAGTTSWGASALAPPATPIRFRMPEAMPRMADGSSLESAWGKRLDIDGDRCVVGGSCASVIGDCAANTQIAEVWEFVGAQHADGGWERVADLAPPEGLGVAQGFGHAVRIEGDSVFVAAPGRTGGAGAVFHFERAADGTWPLRQVIESPVPTAGARFGSALAIEAGRLLVGESGRGNVGLPSGGATLFERNRQGDFVATAVLTVPTDLPGGGWGSGVDIDGETIVIGSTATADPSLPTSTEVGAVATFTLTGGRATFDGLLTSTFAAAAPGAKFSSSMSLDEGLLAITSVKGGLPGDSPNGHADFFVRTEDEWAHAGYWTPGLSGGMGSVTFDVEGELAVMGLGTPPNDSVLLFRRTVNESGGPSVKVLRDISPAFVDETHGEAVAMDGTRVVYRVAPPASPIGLDPLVIRAVSYGDVLGDCDGDGTPNGAETPLGPDCDADFVPDGCGLADCDGNGAPDPCDVALLRVDSVPNGTEGNGLIYASTAGTSIVLLARVQVPTGNAFGATPILKGIAFQPSTSGTGHADPLVMGLCRESDGDGLPDDLLLIAGWTGMVPLESTTTVVPLEGVTTTPGEHLFVAFLLPPKPSGTGVCLKIYDEPLTPQTTWFASVPTSTVDLDDVPTYGYAALPSNLHNIICAGLFRSPNDANVNGLLDVCECEADLSGDGDVGATDIAILLGGWGTPAADVNGDGTTDAADLSLVLGSWGSCGG